MLVARFLTMEVNIVEADQQKRRPFPDFEIMDIIGHDQEQVFVGIGKGVLVDHLSSRSFFNVHQLKKCYLCSPNGHSSNSR